MGGRGHARCSVAHDKAVLEGLLDRSTARIDNDLAQCLLFRVGKEAVIQIEVAWLKSWDVSDRMSSIEKVSARVPGLPETPNLRGLE